MQKYCANCGTCHEQRGFFCSKNCRREFRNKKRNERAGQVCRLCGRRIPAKKELAPVRSEHNQPELIQSTSEVTQ